MSLCYSCPSLSSSPDRQSAGILRGFKRPSTPEDRAAGSPAGGCRDPVGAPSAERAEQVWLCHTEDYWRTDATRRIGFINRS
jgi:hypothetical protein